MATASSKGTSPKANTVADFRSLHDRNVIVPTKIRATFAAMLKEHPEMWHYELDFIKRAGISTTDIGQFREQFIDHVVETSGKNPKRVWFASAKVAAKLRG